jgi:phosphatidylglycerol:prolipoprotein diacylglycerol transferase
MHPIICQIGPITIYSYGLMFALGSLACLIFIIKEGRRQGLDSRIFYDLYFWVLITAIIGARLLYILTNITFFISNPLELVKIYHGGLSWFGGLVFAIFAFIAISRLYKISFFILVDICVPYIALAQSIGRIGCFLNGCCFGKPTDSSFGIYLANLSQKVYPTQLISSFGLFLIFIILKFIQRQKGNFSGKVFSLYFLLCGLERFLTEFFRGDTIPTLINISLYQIFSLISIFAGIILYLILRRRQNKIVHENI